MVSSDFFFVSGIKKTTNKNCKIIMNAKNENIRCGSNLLKKYGINSAIKAASTQ
jgi:hypothetical protein